MEATVMLLMVVALMVVLCFVRRIVDPLRQHFPRANEQQYQWSQRDPMGHW
jgi:hypothetical protein